MDFATENAFFTRWSSSWMSKSCFACSLMFAVDIDERNGSADRFAVIIQFGASDDAYPEATPGSMLIVNIDFGMVFPIANDAGQGILMAFDLTPVGMKGCPGAVIIDTFRQDHGVTDELFDIAVAVNDLA